MLGMIIQISIISLSKLKPNLKENTKIGFPTGRNNISTRTYPAESGRKVENHKRRVQAEKMKDGEELRMREERLKEQDASAKVKKQELFARRNLEMKATLKRVHEEKVRKKMEENCDGHIPL